MPWPAWIDSVTAQIDSPQTCSKCIRPWKPGHRCGGRMKATAAFLAVAFLLVGVLVYRFVPTGPEMTMPESWRVWLTFDRKHGKFVGENYWYCPDSGYWEIYRPTGDRSYTDRPCWIFLLPKGLE